MPLFPLCPFLSNDVVNAPEPVVQKAVASTPLATGSLAGREVKLVEASSFTDSFLADLSALKDGIFKLFSYIFLCQGCRTATDLTEVKDPQSTEAKVDQVAIKQIVNEKPATNTSAPLTIVTETPRPTVRNEPVNVDQVSSKAAAVAALETELAKKAKLAQYLAPINGVITGLHADKLAPTPDHKSFLPSPSRHTPWGTKGKSDQSALALTLALNDIAKYQTDDALPEARPLVKKAIQLVEEKDWSKGVMLFHPTVREQFELIKAKENTLAGPLTAAAAATPLKVAVLAPPAETRETSHKALVAATAAV